MSGSALMRVVVTEMGRKGRVQEAPSEEKLMVNSCRSSWSTALSTAELRSEWQGGLEMMAVPPKTAHPRHEAQG